MSATSFLPFLYQTRTILKTPRVPVTFLRSLHATPRRRRVVEKHIPFIDEVGKEPGSVEPAQPSTITPTERQIFERIFADIQARGLQPSIRGGRHRRAPDGGAAAAAVAPEEPSQASSSRSAMLIMQQAAQDAGQGRAPTVQGPGLLAGAAKDRNKALLRFPPELRAAASKALNAIDPTGRGAGGHLPQDEAAKAAVAKEEATWKAPPHTFMRQVELDAKRQPERMRVEGLINAARTDHELWDVLEAEVFSMPPKLGLGSKVEEEEAEAEGPVLKKRGRKPKNKEEDVKEDEVKEDEAEEEAEDPVSQESQSSAEESGSHDSEASEGLAADSETDAAAPEKISLYIHGPLYPAYLLLALRRLNTAFGASSPLALNMLPRIKELGLESYVLGVSTPFYNELLDIYWTRYGDLVGLLDLLEEMRHCGLYFDRQTSSILGRVQAAVGMLARGLPDSSSFGAAIMTMPHYEESVRSRIRHWHQAVDISIDQRGEDLGY